MDVQNHDLGIGRARQVASQSVKRRTINPELHVRMMLEATSVVLTRDL